MYQQILAAIHARASGSTTIATGSDGKIKLKSSPMKAYLVYENAVGIILAYIKVVHGGFVIFDETIYQKWAEECIAAREGKSPKPARPRPWKQSFGWQQK